MRRKLPFYRVKLTRPTKLLGLSLLETIIALAIFTIIVGFAFSPLSRVLSQMIGQLVRQESVSLYQGLDAIALELSNARSYAVAPGTGSFVIPENSSSPQNVASNEYYCVVPDSSVSSGSRLIALALIPDEVDPIGYTPQRIAMLDFIVQDGFEMQPASYWASQNIIPDTLAGLSSSPLPSGLLDLHYRLLARDIYSLSFRDDKGVVEMQAVQISKNAREDGRKEYDRKIFIHQFGSKD